ncbi:MAG: rod shape-determining protein MreC [Proteobacteria bacterium]|nr:rod shape-determining protein MreC [Pseudomonadota bacterium]
MLKRRFVNYGLAGILLVIPVFILQANLKEPSAINGFDQAILRISSPLQALASWVIEGIGGVWNRYIWLVDIEEENEELRADNRKLRLELAAARGRATDIEVLEKLVGLREKTPADTVGARVISASTNAFFRVNRIRLETGEHELATGMPVISEDGLVGRIGRVYGDYADVLLAIDPQSSIAVQVQHSGSRGSLRGMGRDNSYACEIEMLERRKEPVKQGDLIVTTDLGDFPGGIPVGRVADVATKDYSIFEAVEVDPVVDFANLRQVIVILAKPPAPDPDADKRGRSGQAFGATPY